MTINNALAGAAVRNLDEATAWYGRLLRQAPDRQPMPNDVEYRFAGGGWLHGFVDPQRAGKSSVTTLGALEKAGIAHAGPTRTDFVDTAILGDPDGNQVVLAQPKSNGGEKSA
jgi:catechol 2,3-dioxygenase-like lactoylglutathione lyase family enzyme